MDSYNNYHIPYIFAITTSYFARSIDFGYRGVKWERRGARASQKALGETILVKRHLCER